MSHNMEKITCSKTNCTEHCVKIIRPDSTECFSRVPFFATYHRWSIENMIAYKQKQNNMYYVKQSLRRIFKNVTQDPPLVWRPQFWGMKQKHQRKQTEAGIVGEIDQDIRTIDNNTLMFGNGTLHIYDNKYNLITTKKITDLSIHDGLLSDKKNFGLDQILENYFNNYIFVVWKWEDTKDRYDETSIFYGMYDFSSDLEPDKDGDHRLVNDRNFKEPINDNQLSLFESKLMHLKQLVGKENEEEQKKKFEHYQEEERRKQEEQKKKQEEQKKKQEEQEQKLRMIQRQRKEQEITSYEEEKTLLNDVIKERKQEIANIESLINNKNVYGLTTDNITQLEKDINQIKNPESGESLDDLEARLKDVESTLIRLRSELDGYDPNVKIHIGGTNVTKSQKYIDVYLHNKKAYISMIKLS